MVAVTLIVLFRRFGALAPCALVASTLPVLALLG